MSMILSEDIKLKNILQQLLMICDAPPSASTTRSTVLMGDEVPISRIVEYVQDQLPNWSIEHLIELWKCLVAVPTDDRESLRQFEETIERWIAKMEQIQTQDDNNNMQEKVYDSVNSTTTMDSMKTDIDRELELRMRIRKFDEENINLREELVQAEELIMNLEHQRNNLENQLGCYIKKCQQLEVENDEQKDQLNEVIKKERTCASALQRSMKECNNLLKQLELAEIEMQAIPSLKNKMEKIGKEKVDCMKQIARLQEEFYEREEECEKLKNVMTELENTNSSMKETYEYTICNLREENRQLADENMELQSWSALNLSMSPTPDIDDSYVHSTPCKPQRVPLNSLYAELKASGFTVECIYNLRIQELEEELNQYDIAISTILEQLEKIIQTFVTMLGTIDVSQLNSPDTEDTRTYNIKMLKHKVAYLFNMVTEDIARRKSIKDSSTQLRADSTDVTKSLDQFGIMNFQDLLKYTRQCAGTDTNTQSIVSQNVDENDPFLKVIREKVDIQNRSINEFVEELDQIIQNTINPPDSREDHSASGNSRYRSIYTLPSSLPSLQPSLLSVEDTIQASSCQSSRTNDLDVSFAHGDGLTQENCEKSIKFETESHDVSDQKDLFQPDKSQSSEMPKVLSNAMKMDSRMLPTVEETSSTSFQAPEINGATVAISESSPRRKISVYYRSFDVVAVRDSREDDQEPTLEVRRSLSSSIVQDKERIGQDGTAKDHACDRNDAVRYQFNHSYRNTMNDSDSSNSNSPHKQFQDNMLDDELPVVQVVPQKICLAPTRLKLPQKVKSVLNKVSVEAINTEDCASLDANATESSVLSSPPSAVIDSDKCKKDNISMHSSSTSIIDNCETADGVVFESNSCSVNENFPQGHSTSTPLISLNQPDPAKIADPKDPLSRTRVVQRVDGNQPRVGQSVDSQMSSREDASAGSDSEYEPAGSSTGQCIDEKVAMGTDAAERIAGAASLIGTTTTKVPCKNAVQIDAGKSRDLFDAKQKRRQRRLAVRRSFSDGEGSSGSTLCRCRHGSQTTPLIQVENQSRAFPSLTDVRLEESGIANLPNTEVDSKENLSEFELQKKYTAFSLCLCTDRVTLPRRMEVSLRQRDQSEKNFFREVQKMQQDIQELAPLCTDRESVERVERVRHQLDMIARCAHRVSCTAETLGAVHQERRVSRAVLLADRYLQLLQSRCEKLTANVNETKQILMENNIMIEENCEVGDDLPRIRYRSGTPANNRMMMARRRASVATMSRPMGSTQDMIKDNVRQRNSVSGRVTLRRPSLNHESSKWETGKLDRTDSSSSSIGTELRGISENVESRRGLKEENNNILRLSQSNSQSVINCAIIDDEIWTNAKQETSPEFPSVNEDTNQDCRPCARSSQTFRLRNANMPWRMMLWSILIFFLGFYVNHAISVANMCSSGPRWSIEEILKRYVQIKNAAPHPM